MLPWLLLVILILLVVFGFVAWKMKGVNKRPDYYSWYIIGIVWIVIGIPLEMWVLTFLGIIFSVIGLRHRKLWKKNKRPGLKGWNFWVLLVLLVVLVVLLYLFNFYVGI